jgi:branched-chain amino acid transport system permease protein
MPGFVKKLIGAAAFLVVLYAVNAAMSREGLFGFGLGAYHAEVLMLVGINVILAVSLNLINGFTGQFSIGHAGFMAIGAYSSAYFTVYHGQELEKALGGGTFAHALVFTGAILIGAVVAGGMGLLVGIPSLRLRGDYLAIVTLGFAEIIRIVILNLDVVVHNIVKSDTGRALISIREDELAAEAMGVNTTRYKVLSFAISSAFAGVAGVLFGHFKRFLATPDFTFIKSFEVIIMIVLGGMGSITGAVLGAVVITILPELLRQLPSVGGFNFADLRLVIYAALLIVIMLTRPQGVLGEREIGLHWLRRAQKAPEGDRQVGDDKGVPIAQHAGEAAAEEQAGEVKNR